MTSLLPLVMDHPDWFIDPDETRQACEKQQVLVDDLARMTDDEFHLVHPDVRSMDLWNVRQGLMDADLTEVGIRALLGEQVFIVEYSGSGDSGQLDNIYIEGSDETVDQHVQDLVEHYIDRYLEGLPDWYNNEGGGGQARLDTTTGALDFTHYQNHENSESDENDYNIEEQRDFAAFVRRVKRHAPTAVKILIERSYGGDETACAVGPDDRTIPVDLSRIAGYEDITSAFSAGRGDDESIEIVIDLAAGTINVSTSWVETIKGDDEYYSFNIYGNEEEYDG